MTTPLIDGPRKGPASGGSAKQLVVFAHGYGADGNDLIGLSAPLSSVLPDAAFVSPNAPEPCAMNPFGGRQWFPLTRLEPEEYEKGVRTAAPSLDAFLDAELETLGLDDSALALVGFSQGTMMSLHCGLRRAKSPAAIVGFSGMLAAPEVLKDELKGKPPIFLAHGDMDEVIPVQQMAAAEEVLTGVGLSVETHVSRGIGHGIHPTALELAAGFLKKAFEA